MPARLVPLKAGPAPTITLQRPVVLIGRHPECDVRLDLPEISRRHCCLALAYERIVIRDLGSRKGVRVNGRPVDEAVLKPGDEIAIAHLLYRLENAPQAAAPAPAPAQAQAQAGGSGRSPSPVQTTPRPGQAPRPAEPSSLPELPVELVDSREDLVPLDLDDLNLKFD